MSVYKVALLVVWVILLFVGGFSTKSIIDFYKAEEKNVDARFTVWVFFFIYTLLLLALFVCSVEVFK